MGKIKQGVLGGFSGKVGTVIGAHWKGIAYMRAIPAKVHNPNTPKQKEHRARFAATSLFLRPLAAILKQTWAAQATQKLSAYNAAFIYHLKNATTYQNGKAGIDYTQVVLTQGNLPDIGRDYSPAVIKMGNRYFVDVNWMDKKLDTPNATDLAHIVVYNIALGAVATEKTPKARSTGNLSVDIPANWNKDDLKIWLYFTDPNAEEPTYSPAFLFPDYTITELNF